jgi:hypothetical protein
MEYENEINRRLIQALEAQSTLHYLVLRSAAISRIAQELLPDLRQSSRWEASEMDPSPQGEAVAQPNQSNRSRK